MIRQPRQSIAQEWSTLAMTVTTVPQQVSGVLGPSSLISTVVFSVPGTAANAVFLGPNSGVTLTSGIEIPAGIPQQYRTINERELVELESIALDQLVALTCRQALAEQVPIIVWDLSNMWLVATAATPIVIGTFKEMWI